MGIWILSSLSATAELDAQSSLFFLVEGGAPRWCSGSSGTPLDISGLIITTVSDSMHGAENGVLPGICGICDYSISHFCTVEVSSLVLSIIFSNCCLYSSQALNSRIKGRNHSIK